MRLFFKKRSSTRLVSRLKTRARIRKKISGTEQRPRLCVFRSGKHMYAQLIDDVAGTTLASASSLKLGKSGSAEVAKTVGQEIAKAAAGKSIKNVVFDRSGYVYRGRVKALAEGAREGGLEF